MLSTLEELIKDMVRKGQLLISENHPYCGHAIIASAKDLATIAKIEVAELKEGLD